MKHAIRSVADLGLVLRAVRKSSGVRQDDLAATVGVSKQFTADVERGKPTVQLGRVLKLLAEMGIMLSADIPDSVAPALHKLQAKPPSPPSGR
jgi:y4mF family transcriptional regulator